MQKKVPELLELELQVVGSCLTWAPGTELWSSASTVKTSQRSPGLGEHSLLRAVAQACETDGTHSAWLKVWVDEWTAAVQSSIGNGNVRE